jgi:hypothetical protein
MYIILKPITNINKKKKILFFSALINSILNRNYIDILKCSKRNILIMRAVNFYKIKKL